MTMQQQPVALPPFTPANALRMYLDKQIDPLCQNFLNVLNYFSQRTAFNISAQDMHYLNEFVKTFLYIFTQTDFVPPDKYAPAFVGFNHVISNLVAITSFKNTDAQLEMLRNQQFNYTRVLTLYSARNTILFDAKTLFDLNGQLASLWYCMYASSYYSGLVTKTVSDNLKRHYAFEHPNLLPLADIQELYFGSTYLDGVSDRIIKQKVNAAVKTTTAKMPPIHNKPQPGKIGVFSTMWTPNHSVFRNYSAFLTQMRNRYDLTFFKLGKNVPHDTSMFHHVHTVESLNELMNHTAFRENQFQVFYYPDVGMSGESIVLGNRRVAPIQICSPGHSVSTYGAEIDYFISGVDVETTNNPEQNYSERLVLLPGMGVIHNKPLYTPTGKKKQTEDIIINCSWFAQKVNYSFVQSIRKLLDGLKRKVKLRVFLGHSSGRKNDHLPFVLALISQLGQENVQVYAGLGYGDYMGIMEEGDLSIESFHFGGCNTVSDSLYLGIPMITWEGNKWYNRIGSQMLRLTDLHDCITTNEADYIAKITELVHDDEKRQKLRERVAKADLNKTIYNEDEAKYFEAAVDYLVANHEKLQADGKRDPIVIPR